MSPETGARDAAAGEFDRPGLRIFLNYRREDSADAAGRLYDALASHFGDRHVFMDIDAIEPGVDFEEVLNEAVGRCDVLLAVIGRNWLTVTDARGRRRLDKPDDYVRMELQAALERDVRVIPVLVQGVDMPGSDELPGGLKKLARRNALEVSPARWRYDIGRLTSALERIAETTPEQQARADAAEPGDVRPEPPPKPTPQPDRSRNLLPLILAGIIALVGLAVGALVASGAFSHGGPTHTIISLSAAGSGSNKPNKANPAAANTTPAAGTTPTPSTTPATSTTPAAGTAADASGSLPHHCGTGIDTTASVSCALANNVFYEYYTATQSGGNTAALSAWSPHTNQYYDVSCSPGTEIVKCAVSGTTDPNAEIDLAQAALGIYTPEQASSYAAKADLGPNG